MPNRMARLGDEDALGYFALRRVWPSSRRAATGTPTVRNGPRDRMFEELALSEVDLGADAEEQGRVDRLVIRRQGFLASREDDLEVGSHIAPRGDSNWGGGEYIKHYDGYSFFSTIWCWNTTW
jgi:hypothetical protein